MKIPPTYNNPYIEKELKAIQNNLSNHLSSGGSRTGKGNARESVINEFLKLTLPHTYRIGSGDITDIHDYKSGHCDVVVELPFHLKFEMPATNQSLFIAESVGVVIEVKSDLARQWKEVIAKAKDIKTLKRNTTQSQMVIPRYWVEPNDKIPFYVIAYSGWGSLKTLQQKILDIDLEYRPDGVLIIDKGLFVGTKFKSEGVWSLFSFSSEILLHLRTFSSMHTNPFAYCINEVIDLIDEDIDQSENYEP
jgi:hypothetical protein